MSLPDGWLEVSLETIVDILDSQRAPLNSYEREKRTNGKSTDQLFPYYGATGQVGYVDDYIFNESLVLLGEDGVPFFDPLRHKAYRVEGKCWVNNHAHVLRAKSEVSDGHYIASYLNSFDYTGFVSGTTRLKLTQAAMRTIPVPLPPLNEQKRIADKLDVLLAQVDACSERLGRMPQIIKRFRQAVLVAATSGALTEEWRNTGTPEWRHVCLADISDIQGGVTKDSKKQQAADEEVPYLRVANVQRGYLDLNEIKTIRIPSNKITSILLEPGDILFNEGGDIDKLGRGWIWEGQIPRCSFQNHVFRVRLFSKSDQPKYISWWGNSRGIEYFLRQGKQTTNLASINKTMLGNLPVSLPPPEEQQEIVRRVETLFAFADHLEARYTAAHTQVENMTPSLLAKAFCGELVPQDPNDEPANELLKRIKEQKLNEPEQKRRPRANTINNERNMNTKAVTTLDELVSVLDQLGGAAMADLLLMESGLTDDIDRFFELLREGRKELLDVSVGSNKPIRRAADANQ